MSGEHQNFSSVPINLSAQATALNDLFGLANTTAGQRITHENVMRYSPVWSAVSMISGDIARLPLHLMRQQPNGISRPAKDRPDYAVVRRRPNEQMAGYKFWRRTMNHVLIWGAAFVLIRKRAGRVTNMLHLLPDRTELAMDPMDFSLHYVTEINGERWILPTEFVLHFEWMGLAELNSLDPVLLARDTWAAGLAAIDFQAKFFKRGGRLGGVLELPHGISKKAGDVLEEGFRKTYEDNDAAFQSVVLRDGAKFHVAQSSMVDAQQIASREEGVRDVARIYNIAPSRLGLASQGGYNSKAEDNRDYLDTTLAPHMEMITSELNNKLLDPREVDPPNENTPSLYFGYETDAMLRQDRKSRYEAYATAISGRFLAPNEARAAENLEPYDGGDEFVNPFTTSGGGPEPREDVSAAFRRLFVGQATKVLDGFHDCAKRLKRKPMDFGDFVDNHQQIRLKLLQDALEPTELAWQAVSGQTETHLWKSIGDAINSSLLRICETTAEAKLASAVERLRDEWQAAAVAKIEETIQ